MLYNSIAYGTTKKLRTIKKSFPLQQLDKPLCVVDDACTDPGLWL